MKTPTAITCLEISAMKILSEWPYYVAYITSIRTANTFTIISNRCHLILTVPCSDCIVTNQVTTQQRWNTRTRKFIFCSNKNKIPLTYSTVSTKVRMACHVKHTILKRSIAQQYADTTNQIKLLILYVYFRSRGAAYTTRYCNTQV
jgi:hypothetical protein